MLHPTFVRLAPYDPRGPRASSARPSASARTHHLHLFEEGHSRVRAKAVCVVRRGDAILVNEPRSTR